MNADHNSQCSIGGGAQRTSQQVRSADPEFSHVQSRALLEAWFERAIRDTRVTLSTVLDSPCEKAPSPLLEAMHYACQGGKRLRPLLVLGSAQAAMDADSFPNSPSVLRVAAAVELIHAHSLIYDDLPAMDGSDVRRGRPTVHRAFDEATAMLAGTALLVRAFGVLADPAIPPSVTACMLTEITMAIGSDGVIGGQLIDLDLDSQPTTSNCVQQVQRMHDLKTGQLIRLACRLGSLAVGASPQFINRLDQFGAHLGRAFQALDDVLDETSTLQELGKPVRQDIRAGRNTMAGTLGVESSVQVVQDSAARAIDSISDLDRQADPLRAVVHDFVTRRLPH